MRLLVRAPGVKCEPLTAYACEPLDADRTIVRLGDLTSNQEVELVFQLTFPHRAIGTSIEILADNDRQPRARAVDRLVADKFAA